MMANQGKYNKKHFESNRFLIRRWNFLEKKYNWQNGKEGGGGGGEKKTRNPYCVPPPYLQKNVAYSNFWNMVLIYNRYYEGIAAGLKSRF